jgi:EAL domain-containing protein (putative c-di-GMP-specific phosphodiesterase class I)
MRPALSSEPNHQRPEVTSQVRVRLDDARAELEGLIDADRLTVVYQPIVDLGDQSLFAYEALARSSCPSFESPTGLFVHAASAGKVGALGRVLRQRVADSAPEHHLFVNIHPLELGEHWLLEDDDPIFGHTHRVYLEITETMPVDSFDEFRHALDGLRSRPNVYFVVDDLGAGFSNLRRISDLAPSVVKIDRNLITGLPDSERQRRLLAAIVRLCTDLGAKVVAEGIETHDEFLAARDAGSHYGQGYLWARPAYPLPTTRRTPDT